MRSVETFTIGCVMAIVGIIMNSNPVFAVGVILLIVGVLPR